MMLRFTLGLGLSLGICSRVFAAEPPAKVTPPPVKKEEKPKAKTFVTAEESPADLKLQGEYGDAAGGKFGVQVIALEDLTVTKPTDAPFRAVVYPGGLPGAGWNGDKATKVEIDGKRESGKVTFSGKGFVMITDGSSLTLAQENGETMQLKKIVRQSPTMGATPPAGAKVLYGGPGDAGKWQGGHADDRGLLFAGTKTVDKFKDFSLHLEFLLPFKPGGRGQDRGNSGVYLQDRYECQVLDSFALQGLDNECGGFYKQASPKVNMCLPPLQWQTYDIEFTAAKFDAAGNKTAKARATVKHNGVVIHENFEFEKPTPGGGLSGKDNADAGPIQLQGHGNPVFFRNIWIVEK